jgi:hypothetical protein
MAPPLASSFARLDYATGVTPMDRARSLRETGVETLLVQWPNNQPYCFGWDGRDGYDYKPMELLLAGLVRERPEARFVLSFGSLHGTPYYWGVDHLDELAFFNMGRRMQAASLGSDLWREDTADAARRYARHFAQGEFADRVVGFFAFNTAVDWHGTGEVSANVPRHEVPEGYEFALEGDISEPMRRAFRGFLVEAYESDGALQQAWRQVGVTRETAELPTRVEVRSPLPNVRDYFRCYNRLNARLAAAWCQALSEGGDGRPVGLLHAYAFGWPQESDPPQGSGHAEPDRLLRSKGVDFLVSPPACGPDAACPLSSHPVASLRLHGKSHVHVVEAPSLVDRTPAEQMHLLTLNIGYAASHRSRVALGELRAGPGSLEDTRERMVRIPYDHDEVRAHVKRLCDWHGSLPTDAEPVRAQVAVFVSTTAVYGRGIDPLYGRRHVADFRERVLARVGLPFDEFYLADFEAVADRYRAWILLDVGDASDTVWQRVVAAGDRAIQPGAAGVDWTPATLRERLSAVGVEAWSDGDDFLAGSEACVCLAARGDGVKSLRLPDARLVDVVTGEVLLPADGCFRWPMRDGEVRLFARGS